MDKIIFGILGYLKVRSRGERGKKVKEGMGLVVIGSEGKTRGLEEQLLTLCSVETALVSGPPTAFICTCYSDVVERLCSLP